MRQRLKPSQTTRDPLPTLIAVWLVLIFIFDLIAAPPWHYLAAALGQTSNLIWLAACGGGLLLAATGRLVLDRSLPVFLVCCYGIVAVALIGNDAGLSNPNESDWKAMTKVLLIVPVIAGLAQRYAKLAAYAFFLGSVGLAVQVLLTYFAGATLDFITDRPMIEIVGRDTNFITAILVFATPIALTIGDRLATRSWLYAALCWSVIPLFYLTIVICQARMGLLMATAGIGGWVLFIRSHRSKLPIVATASAGFVAAFVLFGTGLTQRLTQISDSSSMDRLRSSFAGFELFSDQPWLGVGMGETHRYFFDVAGYQGHYYEHEMQSLSPHNTIAQMLTESGVIGLVLLCALLAYVVHRILMAPTNQNLRLAGLCFLPFMLCAMTLPMAYVDWFYLTLAITLAIAHWPLGSAEQLSNHS